jgi:hypothetical protein
MQPALAPSAPARILAPGASTGPAGALFAHYYQHAYQAESVPAPATYAPSPPRAHVPGVPAISYASAYCQTASLQMLDRDPTRAALDVHAYNWLTGFTYGALYQNDINSFLPYNDPEVCFQPAVRELGMQRRFYVTGRADEFGQFLKHLLASQQPVRVALNGNHLLRRPGFFPHAVVVVGYEGDTIRYHETGLCDRYLPHHPGEQTTLADLLTAAAQLSAAFRHPWHYTLTVLEPTLSCSSGHETPPPAVRNGRALAGTATPFAHTGVQALRALANYLQAKPVAATTWKQVRFRFAAGVYTRRDNAAYLRREPVLSRRLAPAADWLAASGEHFAAIVALLDQLNPVPAAVVADHLLAVADLEDQVAHLLLQVG